MVFCFLLNSESQARSVLIFNKDTNYEIPQIEMRVSATYSKWLHDKIYLLIFFLKTNKNHNTVKWNLDREPQKSSINYKENATKITEITNKSLQKTLSLKYVVTLTYRKLFFSLKLRHFVSSPIFPEISRSVDLKTVKISIHGMFLFLRSTKINTFGTIRYSF